MTSQQLFLQIFLHPPWYWLSIEYGSNDESLIFDLNMSPNPGLLLPDQVIGHDRSIN